MQPVRVLAIMEDPASQQSAINTLQPLVDAKKVELIVAEDMTFALTHLVQCKCPYDLVLCDLNFSDKFRRNDVLTLPETMQTGHFLTLTALRTNPHVRCIVAINDERDISSSVSQYGMRAVQMRVRSPDPQPTYDWMLSIRMLYPDFQSAA